jgi:predicted site-specific integrase-resolvase
VLLNQQGKDIEVVNLAEERKDDLMEDFVAIIVSFRAKLYSLRRETLKKLNGINIVT